MSTLRFVLGTKSWCIPFARRLPAVGQKSVSCMSTNSYQSLNKRNLFSVGTQKSQETEFVKIFSNALIKRHLSIDSEPTKTDKGIQVYEGRVKGLMKKVKIFSLTTSFIGLVGQPYLWYSVQDMSLLLAAPMFTAINFFVFANPLMIHYLAKRYVTELYYNPQTETYTATVLSLFARKHSFSFTPNDVVIPEIPGLFSMVTVKGRPLFIHDDDFTSIEVYKKMMGFDKPLDLTYVADKKEK